MAKKSGLNTYAVMLIAVAAFLVAIVVFGANLRSHNADVLEEVLVKKKLLIEELLFNPLLIETVQAANQRNAQLTPIDITQLDNQWRNAVEGSDFINLFIENPAAEHLRYFRDKYPEFKEIFITDKHGLNVATTNRTSDYYQADETWWIGVFDSLSHSTVRSGEIEWDESANVWSIPIYALLVDQAGQKIGVLKAILDIGHVRRK